MGLDADAGLVMKLARARVALLEIIMVSVVLAIGLSLISSLLIIESQLVTLAVGVLLVGLVLIWYVVSRLRGARHDLKLEAFFLYDSALRDLMRSQATDSPNP